MNCFNPENIYVYISFSLSLSVFFFFFAHGGEYPFNMIHLLNRNKRSRKALEYSYTKLEYDPYKIYLIHFLKGVADVGCAARIYAFLLISIHDFLRRRKRWGGNIVESEDETKNP